MNDVPGSETSPDVGTPGAPWADAPPGAAPVMPAEWATKAADSVELAVALVSDRAIRPIVIGARAVVFGVLIVALAVAVIVWSSVGFIRLLDVYLWPGEVWASYLLLGGVFTISGMVTWYYATSRAPTSGT